MHKYGESKTTRILMATVHQVASSSGLRKFQAAWFLLNRGYMTANSVLQYVVTDFYKKILNSLYAVWFHGAHNTLDYTCNESMDLTLLIFRKLKDAQQHYPQNSHIIFHLNKINNVAGTNRNSFIPLTKGLLSLYQSLWNSPSLKTRVCIPPKRNFIQMEQIFNYWKF